MSDINVDTSPNSNTSSEVVSNPTTIKDDKLMKMLVTLHKHDPKSDGDCLDPITVYKYIEQLTTQSEIKGRIETINALRPEKVNAGKFTTEHWEGYKMAMADMRDRCDGLLEELTQMKGR